MMSCWQAPRWAKPPAPHEWSLEEIKGGIVVGNHNLDRPCTTFGRAADAVTIPTNHESCSRLHARIAFDSAGVPWLRDLGSGNGTTVNKKRLPQKSVGRAEDGRGEGSRGVVVFPGDTIQFGASTRIFCLVGPDEFDRGVLAEKKAKEMAAAAQAKAMGKSLPGLSETRSKDEDEGVTWGIDTTDAAAYDEDDRSVSQPSHPLESVDIPEKHRKCYERLLAKKYKLENLRKESERIQQKSVISELTDGQTAQLERNRQRGENLAREVDEMERELRDKVLGKRRDGCTYVPSTRKRGSEYEDDVDDFYDRTVNSNKKSRGGNREEEIETEQSLTLKWKSLISKIRTSEEHLQKAQRKVDAIKRRIAVAGETDEDVFFLKNDLEIAEDNSKKAMSDRNRIEKELATAERMLGAVNEKLTFDRDLLFVGEKLAKNQAKPRSPSEAKQIIEEDSAMPPPPPPGKFQVPGGEMSSQTSTGGMIPPPRRKPPVGPSLLDSTDTNSKEGSVLLKEGKEGMPSLLRSTTASMPPPSKRKPRGPMLPTEGTLSVFLLASQSKGRKACDNFGGSNQAAVAENAAALQSLTESKIDPRKDEWRAPDGQDGSGMTKLNEKFGGRY